MRTENRESASLPHIPTGWAFKEGKAASYSRSHSHSHSRFCFFSSVHEFDYF